MMNKKLMAAAVAAVSLMVMAGCDNSAKAPEAAQVTKTPEVTQANVAAATGTQAGQAQAQLQIQTQAQPLAAVVDDTLVAAAMLKAEDLSGISMFAKARPQVTHLDSHLDDKDKVYEFYDLKYWDDRATGNALMDNSITKYPSADAAKEDMTYLAEGLDKVAVTGQVGDAQAVYFVPIDKDVYAHVNYRFTRGEYGGKISIYFQSDKADTSNAKREALAEIAGQLAKIQSQRIGDLIAGKIAAVSNDAILQLPGTISGTKLIGTVPVSDQEWLGTDGTYKRDSVAGYVDGGLRRFSIVSRPHEVVEVIFMGFRTSDDAKKYFNERKPSAKDDTIEIVSLPKTLTDKGANALYVIKGEVADLEAVKGNYMVDLAIFSPFGSVDKAAAEKDLARMAEEIL